MKELKIDLNTASDKALRLFLELKAELGLENEGSNQDWRKLPEQPEDKPVGTLAFPDEEEELPEPPLPEEKNPEDDGFVVD